MKIKVNYTENQEEIGFITLDNGITHSFPSRNLPF